jgi:cytoskeletal protein CcmA (bactofilin family)
VSVEDSVAGDLMASGAVVSVTAPVAGDLLSAGARVTASGPVAGSVRAAGATVTLAGVVGHNVTLAGGSVRVAPTGKVEGNAYLAGGEIVIEGEVTGSVRASAGTVRILGSVNGPVELKADRVVVGPGAHLAAGLTHTSPNVAEVAAGARIDGTISHRPAAGPLTSWVDRFLRMVAFLFTGTVLVALFPRTFVGLRDALRERPWPTLGLGLAALIAIPITLVLLVVTMLGLPLALIGAALFAAALYLGRTVAAVWLGDRVLDGGPGRGARIVAFLLGGVILLLAGLLPWIGWVVTLAATLAGLGAAVKLTNRGWRRGGVAGESG